MKNLHLDEVITNAYDLRNHYIFREGFMFTSVVEPANVFDGIVIRNPSRCPCSSPRFPFSGYSLQEHIDFVNQYGIEKAVVIAENIDFIKQCPSLKYLWIIPADSAEQNFDYSPLYELSEIRSLSSYVIYGEHDEKSTTIDLTKIKGLKYAGVNDKGHLNYQKAPSMEILQIAMLKDFDSLQHISEMISLKDLTLLQTGVKNLLGLEKLENLQSLTLWYNRSLTDFSSIVEVAHNIRHLSIENCPNISDFTILKKLTNLEYLCLEGKNDLPDLSFLEYMPNLKVFCFSMNVIDGDMTPCLKIPYVAILKGRKHYNLKDKDMPKEKQTDGFRIK